MLSPSGKSYPFEALTSNKLKPPTVSPEIYGHHYSTGFDRDRRLWGFLTLEARKAFVQAYFVLHNAKARD